MSNVAYNERDINQIIKKERVNKLYKIIKGLQNIFLKKTAIIKISTYPIIKNKDELIEIINKLSWAYPYKENMNINIYVSEELKNFNYFNVESIPFQRNYIKNNHSHIKLVSKYDFSSDKILITKAKALLKFNLFKFYKTEIIDKDYFSSTEGVFLQNAYYEALNKKEKNDLIQNSTKNFNKMIELNKHKNDAYCFVSGPSFDKYNDFNYEKNSFKIICNSIVKNNDFLEVIGKPDLLVFADPVFHFSPSEYSAMFRDYVIKVFNKYKCYIVVPEMTVGLLLEHYPQLKTHLIGMAVKKDHFNFPNDRNFYVKQSANILTLLMIPIASAISNNINILGADGRDPNEKYFWKHSSSAQFDDLMESVFQTHPSFFRDRDYKDYYNEHCEFLESLIRHGEKNGKSYTSLTNSFIPSLLKRIKHD